MSAPDLRPDATRSSAVVPALPTGTNSERAAGLFLGFFSAVSAVSALNVIRSHSLTSHFRLQVAGFLHNLLKHRQGIDRRAAPVLHGRGRGHEQKLPTVQLRGRVGDRFEVQVVEQIRTERHDGELVDR